MPIQSVPFPPWVSWWRENPHATSLAAGAVAGMAAEAVLFPLDCFKTRVQSQAGFQASGGFKGAYRGFGTAISGSAPASAIFFMTYEFSKHSFAFYDFTGSRTSLLISGWMVVSGASMLGELAACVVRVPVDLAKQRMQVGHASSFREAVRGVRNTHRAIVFASFRATAMRDLSHSSLQYPMYEFLKIMLAKRTGRRSCEHLPSYQAAMCGSVAGALSAMVTTPLDLLKTRLNLRSPDLHGSALEGRRSSLVVEEIRNIYASKGLQGFFSGASFRAAWMGLGGFVFLGSFEFTKDRLTLPPCERNETTLVHAASGSRKMLGEQPPALLSFVAGLIAGICVDVPLHPVDTMKTRLQGPAGFYANGGFKGLWNGLSAVLLTSVPGSAIFFVVYERIRYALDHQTFFDHKAHEISRDAVAASVADVGACSVRVPCEVLKQRMQISGSSFASTFTSTCTEGVRGFYAGLGATICREVPFALVQMPLFEEFKRNHPLARHAEKDAKLQGVVGMTSGCLAGAIGGAVTTPFDTTKTRIMLTESREKRGSMFRTMLSILSESGIRGLFSGVLPRTIHCTIGGALWLGSFDFCNRVLKDFSSS